MRTRDELEAALEALLRHGYYAEDFELMGSLKQFETSIQPEERDAFDVLVLQRLSEEPSIVNVMICSVARVPEAVPILMSILETQPNTSQLTRMAIAVLGQYGAATASPVIERFLDSDQEGEALTALAAIDFRGTLFHLCRYARRKRLLDHALQILHQRRKAVGLDGLCDDLVAQRAVLGDMTGPVHLMLEVRQGKFNPFSEEERATIMARLAGA